jgi:hypothetical protein
MEFITITDVVTGEVTTSRILTEDEVISLFGEIAD